MQGRYLRCSGCPFPSPLPPSLSLPPPLTHSLPYTCHVCVCENNCNGGRGSTKLESGSGRLEPPVRPSWSVQAEGFIQRGKRVSSSQRGVWEEEGGLK